MIRYREVHAPAGRADYSSPAVLRGAQVAWIAVAVFAAAVFILDLPPYFHHAFTLTNSDGFITHNAHRWRIGLHSLGLSPSFYAGYLLSIQLIVAISVFLTGAIIFLRRSHDRLALFLSATLVVAGTMLPGPAWEIGQAYPVLSEIAPFVAILSILALGALTCVFPDGKFTPRWTRWCVAAWLIILLGRTFLPGTPIDIATWPLLLAVIVVLPLVATCIFAPVYRYRRVSDWQQRQQTKWVMAGIVLVIACLAIDLTTQQIFPGLVRSDVNAVLYDLATITLFGIGFSLLPVSVGIAIFRYHLWDIDTLINRALVYGSLTVSLAALYVGGVIGVQALLRALTGQSSELAVAIVTLAIAALFNPWRHRLQRFIDQRFYRKKYDARRTLAAFQSKLRDGVDLDELTDEVVAVVADTMQPDRVALWLAHPGNP